MHNKWLLSDAPTLALQCAAKPSVIPVQTKHRLRAFMEILFWVVVIAAAFWYFMMLRGRKAVRAFVFLSEIIEDKSEDEANITASRIDFFAASKVKHQMSNFVNTVYGGSQLTMISQARASGFKE